jgi:ribosome assembly protein 1
VLAVQVSTAVRLCDGALVVIDAAEGVCIQTHAVLRQARAERVVPCLVINKIDRLIIELGLEPEAAYERLLRIVDEANGVFAAMASAEFLAQADDAAGTEDFECEFVPCMRLHV